MSGECVELLGKVSRHFQAEAESLVDLAGENDHGNAHGKPGDHGIGNELDHPAETESTGEKEHQASHHCRNCQTGVTVGGDNGREDRDECAGGAADLEA
jgi:hypothetical protein